MIWFAGLLTFSAPAEAACTVLTGVVAHLPDGPRADASVVVSGTTIAAVGTDLRGLARSGGAATWNGETCALFDLPGAEVTAGLIEVSSQLGLVEIGLEDATNDHDGGGDPIRAAFLAADGYNPRSPVIGVQRGGGLTAAVVNPSGGVVSGQASAVSLAGDTQAETLLAARVAMKANVAGPSRGAGLLALRELLDDAAVFRRSRAAWERNQSRSFVEGASHLDLEALFPVLDREIPLVVGADRASDLEALLRLGDALDIDLVIVGAAEGWMVAGALASAGVPVVVDPLVLGPGSFHQIHARADNARLLADAGVAVIISTFSTHNARTLRQVAGNAVRGGMPHAAALRAITATPAEVFGLEGRGVLRAGAVADLAVWSGDPLELASHVRQLWIGGEQVSLESRQTRLRDAYRTLPGTPRGPLPLPGAP